MKLESCRDCGELTPADARGCRKCARNMVAERMLAKYFWLGVAPVLLLLLCLVVLLLTRSIW
jgi:predicted nucleic acid-binding Zn ribbon protein